MCDCIQKINDKLQPSNDKKKRGKTLNLVATFCPFCGVKWVVG